MGMGTARVKRIGEHVVDEAQQRVEGPGRSLEHTFASVRIGSDGSGASQGILQVSYSDDQISSLVRTRSITASVNSVVPAWPPRSGVFVPEATVSSADS